MEEKQETIKVIYCEPGRKARIAEIGTELSDLQRAVGGGFIETYYPFENELFSCHDIERIYCRFGISAC